MADSSEKAEKAAAATASGIHPHVIETERIGSLNVYVQGEIEHARKGERPVFLTVRTIHCDL